MSLFKSTWHHLRRSPFQSLAALAIMSLTFFVISLLIIGTQGLSRLLQYFETKPEITIFLKDGLTESQVEDLQKQLASYPAVKEIRFISKEKALTLYREQNRDNPLLTEMVTASILPASFEVSVTNPQVLKTIAADFSPKTTLVEEIVFEADIVDSLINWSAMIKKIGLATSLVLLSVSSLIILVIIGMKATSHKDEVRVSRLLGASRFYVEKPFLLEGIFYGLVGSSLGYLISLGIVAYFSPNINQFFSPVAFITPDPLFYLLTFLGTALGGISLGYFSSWLGVRRFIKF